MNMKDINRKLPTGLAIAGGVMLLIMGVVFNFFTIFARIFIAGGHINLIEFWNALSTWILIPMAVVCFCRTKSIFAGCVFVYYGLGHLIRPLVCSLIGAAGGRWMRIFPDTIVLVVFFVLMAIACFGSRKQLLRKVRWLFIVLPVLLPVIAATGATNNVIVYNALLNEDDSLITHLLMWLIAYLPYLLMGFAFFFSYPKQETVPAPRCCSTCGQPLDDTAKFCTACGNSAD
jgi:hypothetical protein